MAVTIDGTSGITFPNSSVQAVAGAPLSVPSFTSTIGVGSATASASGAGITFPATQVASSDANTLDDYEEGTWTPTITCETTNPTLTGFSSQGIYVKVGRLCFVNIKVNWSNSTGGVGNLGISNFPFTAVNAMAYQSIVVGYNGSTGQIPSVCMVLSNATRAFLWTSIGSILTGSATTSADWYISGVYETNQ